MPRGSKTSLSPSLLATAPSGASLADDRAELQAGDRVLLIIEDDPKFPSGVELCPQKGFKCLAAGDGDELG